MKIWFIWGRTTPPMASPNQGAVLSFLGQAPLIGKAGFVSCKDSGAAIPGEAWALLVWWVYYHSM